MTLTVIPYRRTSMSTKDNQERTEAEVRAAVAADLAAYAEAARERSQRYAAELSPESLFANSMVVGAYERAAAIARDPRKNVHCSNCGDTRGGPFGHEIGECTWVAPDMNAPWPAARPWTWSLPPEPGPEVTRLRVQPREWFALPPDVPAFATRTELHPDNRWSVERNGRSMGLWTWPRLLEFFTDITDATQETTHG